LALFVKLRKSAKVPGDSVLAILKEFHPFVRSLHPAGNVSVVDDTSRCEVMQLLQCIMLA
jgi:hypothetical protein